MENEICPALIKKPQAFCDFMAMKTIYDGNIYKT